MSEQQDKVDIIEKSFRENANFRYLFFGFMKQSLIDMNPDLLARLAETAEKFKDE